MRRSEHNNAWQPDFFGNAKKPEKPAPKPKFIKGHEKAPSGSTHFIPKSTDILLSRDPVEGYRHGSREFQNSWQLKTSIYASEVPSEAGVYTIVRAKGRWSSINVYRNGNKVSINSGTRIKQTENDAAVDIRHKE